MTDLLIVVLIVLAVFSLIALVPLTVALMEDFAEFLDEQKSKRR